MGENEESEIIEEEEVEQKELNVAEVIQEEHAVVELSINSVVGLSNPGTMKVKGKLLGREIIVLIDCGATHNFISESLVEELQISTKSTTNYGVILGSGTAIKGKGVCEAIEMMIGEWRVIDDFLLLELGGVDAILGMQWLYSLGITEVDWKNLILTFKLNSDFYSPRREGCPLCKGSYQTAAYQPQYAHCASKKEKISSICFLLVPTLQIVGGSSLFLK